MSSFLSSQNSLVLIGVGILAVLVIFLAIWLARVSSRAAKERAKAEALEQRLSHVEDYLSRMSKREAAPLPMREDDEDDDAPAPMKPMTTGASAGGVKPVSAAKAAKAKSAASNARQSEDRETKQSRRSKRQPVIPYGEAKESIDDVYSGTRPSVSAAPQAVRPMEIGRPSMTRDARRRREARRQDQIRRQAESIVQDMQRSDSGPTRRSVR